MAECVSNGRRRRCGNGRRRLNCPGRPISATFWSVATSATFRAASSLPRDVIREQCVEHSAFAACNGDSTGAMAICAFCERNPF